MQRTLSGKKRKNSLGLKLRNLVTVMTKSCNNILIIAWFFVTYSSFLPPQLFMELANVDFKEHNLKYRLQSFQDYLHQH